MAACLASALETAPLIRISTNFVAPSPSLTICLARDRRMSPRSCRNCAASGASGRERRIARHAVGHDQGGIVGGGVAVDGDDIEGAVDCLPEDLLQQGGINRRVGNDKRQHGGHVGHDHPRPLGHTGDGVISRHPPSPRRISILGKVSVVMMAAATSSSDAAAELRHQRRDCSPSAAPSEAARRSPRWRRPAPLPPRSPALRQPAARSPRHRPSPVSRCRRWHCRC